MGRGWRSSRTRAGRTPADNVGTWIATTLGPLGMNKQIFVSPRWRPAQGRRVRPLPPRLQLATLERVTIVGNTLYFHIAHQDRGNIDPPVFERTVLAQVVQNEMIASVIGNNITIDSANPPARGAGAPFTLVGPIAPDATKGNSSEGTDVWGPGTGSAVQPPTGDPTR